MRQQLGVAPVRPTDAVDKEYTDSDILAFPSMSNQELPLGDNDGINATFTLDHTPVSGSEMVFINGLLNKVGQNNDYTITGSVIVFNEVPPVNTDIAVTYWFVE